MSGSKMDSNLIVLQEKKILSDAQGLIEATNQLMINKNPDEKLQRFIEASAKVTQDATSTATSEMYVLEEKLKPNQNFLLKALLWRKIIVTDVLVYSGEMKVTTTEKKQVQDIYDGLLGFLKMLSTSPEFRRHILDLTNIMQDIFVRSKFPALYGIS